MLKLADSVQHTSAAPLRSDAIALADDMADNALIGPTVRRLRFKSHELIFMEGDPAHQFYEVVEGAVMLYKILPDGRRQVVELLAPGDLFGFTEGDQHGCSAESLVPCRISVVARETVERSADMQGRIFRHTQAQLRVLHDHAVLLGRKSAMERVASFIERLALAGDNDRVMLPMTRQEIADFLGLTIETVSRSFSELRRRGLLSCERQDVIRIPNLDKISQLTGA